MVFNFGFKYKQKEVCMSFLRLLFGLGVIGLMILIIQEYKKQRRRGIKEQELENAISEEEIVELEEKTVHKMDKVAERRAKMTKNTNEGDL